MRGDTGVQLEPGENLTVACKLCNAKIIVTNVNPQWVFVNRCVQCGVTFDTEEVHQSSFWVALDILQRQLLKVRNARISTDDDKWLEREKLHSNLLTLIDNLAMLQLDHKTWHTCKCMECHWTGYNPTLIASGLNAGKACCPKCQSLNVEKI